MRWAPLLVALLACGWFLREIDSPETRYANYPEIYDYIYRQQGDVDVVVFGGSTTMRGFRGTLLQAELEKQGYPLVHNGVIYNCGHPTRSPVLDYIFLRDLLERKKVSLVLLQPYLAGSYHNDLIATGRTSDLIEIELSDKKSRYLERCAVAMQRVRDRIFHHAQNYAYHPDLDQGGACRPASSGLRENHQAVEVWAENVVVDRSDLPHYRHSLRSGRYQQVSLVYLKKMIALARQHGARVALIDVPTYRADELSAEVVRHHEKAANATFLAPNQATLDAFSQDGFWHDGDHFSEKGAQAYMRYMGRVIAQAERDGSIR